MGTKVFHFSVDRLLYLRSITYIHFLSPINICLNIENFILRSTEIMNSMFASFTKLKLWILSHGEANSIVRSGGRWPNYCRVGVGPITVSTVHIVRSRGSYLPLGVLTRYKWMMDGPIKFQLFMCLLMIIYVLCMYTFFLKVFCIFNLISFTLCIFEII